MQLEMCAAVAAADADPVDNMTAISSEGKLLFTDEGAQPAFGLEVMARAVSGLREQRQAREGCDVVFEAADGKEIWAHRFVLSAKYSGCHTLFTAATEALTTGMKPEEQGCIPPIRVTVADLSSDMLQLLVEYAYYTPVHEIIGFQNVGEVLDLSNNLNIPKLRRSCINMLDRNLDPVTCIGIYRLALSKGCDLLAADAFKFLVRNFHQIWESNVEYLSLTPEEMRAILTNDHLHAHREVEDTFRAILKWISADLAERRKYLAQFLPLVRFVQCSASDCEKVVTDPQVQADGDSVKVLNVIYQTLWQPSIAVGVCAGVDLSPKTWLIPRIPKHVIFLFGGWSGVAATNSMLTHNCRTGRWRQLGDQKTVPRAHHAVAVLNSCIYVIGGMKDRLAVHTVACFDVNRHHWSQKAHMHFPRGYPAAAVLKGCIYVIGGWDGLRHSSTVERYDPYTNTWTPVASMRGARSRASAVTVGERIYVIGGLTFNWIGFAMPLNSAEVYDPRTNAWYRVPGMLTPRYGAGIAVRQDIIYIVGGSNAGTELKSMEQYDIRRRIFSELPSMNHSRSLVAAVMVEGSMYVIGGLDGQANLSVVERYDVQAQKWFPVESLSSPCSGAAACVVGVARPEIWA